jgi:hypothetical protein
LPGHLIFSELLGAQELGGAIPATGLVPCALAPDGRVVYGKTTDLPMVKKTRPPTAVKLIPYTPEIKLQRRSLAETVLGYRALNSSDLLKDVLDKVSDAIWAYWRKRIAQLQKEAAPFMVDASKKYLYGASSFGRLAPPAPKAPWINSIEAWMVALSASPRDIPKIMNIQDNFLRIFKSLGPCDLDNRWIRPMPEDLRNQIHGITPPEKPTKEMLDDKTKRDNTLKKIMPDAWEWKRSAMWAKMEATGLRVRPMTLFDPKFRGRTDKGEPVKTNKPGILVDGPGVPDINIAACLKRLDLTLGQLQATEERARGVDRYVPDFASMSPVFKRSVEESHTGFGAGPSGTTGTLLQSAETFTKLEGEELRRYVFACIAYLVGGGMHTCHEVFTTASLLGLPYDEGKYRRSLPASFRSTPAYDAWFVEFYDIAG